MRDPVTRTVAALAVVVAVIGCAAQDSESNRNVAAIAGQTTKIAGNSRLDAACRGVDPPEVKVIEPPDHGTVEIRRTVNTITNPGGGSTRCLGVVAEGLGLFYTPRQGFTGVDRLRYTARYPNLPLRQYTVTIGVR